MLFYLIFLAEVSTKLASSREILLVVIQPPAACLRLRSCHNTYIRSGQIVAYLIYLTVYHGCVFHVLLYVEIGLFLFVDR